MQLGLCMGFSLISAAEVLFHAVQVVLAVIIPRRSFREPSINDNNIILGHCYPPPNFL